MPNTLRETLLRRLIFIGFGLSGAASLIYEVTWTRSLSTIMGSSTYAVSTMLAAFMAGLSIGGAIGAVIAPRLQRLPLVFAACELGIGLCGLILVPVINGLTPLYVKSFYAFHLSFSHFSTIQFLIVFLIMGVPTTLMGLTFPLAIKLFATGDRDIGRQAGFLYSVNTLGAIAGSTAAGFLLIPWLGVSGSASTAAGLNLATAAAIAMLGGGVRLLALLLPLVAMAGGVAAAGQSTIPFFSYYNAFRFGSRDMAEAAIKSIRSQPEAVVFRHQGLESDVALLRYRLHDNEDVWSLTNNGKREAGDDQGFALLAYLPYFLHPTGSNPKRALNIGLGSGKTLGHLARFPLAQIDSVELSEGIVEANRRFLSPALFTDSRIRHIQTDNHLTDKIGVPGEVQEVDFAALPGASQNRQPDGGLPVNFRIGEVRQGGAFVHLPLPVTNPGRKGDGVGKAGFAASPLT